MSNFRILISKRPVVFSVITQVFYSLSASAAPCTLNNEYIVNFATGSCTTQQPADFPNTYLDSVVLQYDRASKKLFLTEDVSGGGGYAGIWNDVTFEGTLTSRSALNLLSMNSSTFQPDGHRKEISTGKLNLINVDIEADVVFKFGQQNNEINFTDSSIYFDTREPLFLSGTSTTVNSLSGDNVWKGGADSVAGNMTFNVTSGGSFEFLNVGSTSNSSAYLSFNGANILNVDNASTLSFHYSGMEFNNSTINVAGSSTLALKGSGTSIIANTLNVNDSTVQYSGGSMSLHFDTANFHNTNLNLGTGSFETKTLALSGNNAVTGDGSIDFLRAEVIRTKDNSATTLDSTGLNQIRAETLLLTPNLTVNLDDTNLRMLTGSDLQMLGGTINANSRGDLSIFGIIGGNSGSINVNGGSLVVGKSAELNLSAGLNLTLSNTQSDMTVVGKLSGSGVIAGSGGDIAIEGTDGDSTVGILSPGSSASPFGTITLDHKLAFVGLIATTDQSLIDTGLFDGSYYDVDIGLTGGTTPVNDKLVYGDYDIDLSRMKALRIDVADNSTAAQLHQKSFRVVEAASGASAGDIIYRGQDVDIEEGPNVPVLIDFFVADDNTNGKADLTIYAEEVLPITLQRHSGVRTQRNTQAVAALVPASSTTPAVPSQPQTPAQQQAQQNVYNNLQTTTNSQVQGNFTSIHPEPISSNMTIQLEQADNMLNTVLSVNTLASGKDQDDSNLGSYFFGSSHSNPTGVWANINYVDGKVDGQGDLGSFDYYLTSYIFGSSFINRSDYELGTFFGFSSEKMDEHDQANIDFSSSAYHLGLYGGLRFDEKLTMNWAFGHSWLSTESSRSTSLGSIQERAEAEYDSQMNYLGVRASYDTSWLQKLESSVFAGLGYLRVDQDAFSESNAPNLGLTVDSAVADSAIVSLGVEMSRSLDVEELTRANVEVRYDYDALAEKNSEHDISASFSFDPSNKQDFVGQNRGQHAVTLALGVDHEFEENWMLSLAGAYTRSSHGYEVGGDLVMNWYW